MPKLLNARQAGRSCVELTTPRILTTVYPLLKRVEEEYITVNIKISMQEEELKTCSYSELLPERGSFYASATMGERCLDED